MHEVLAPSQENPGAQRGLQGPHGDSQWPFPDAGSSEPAHTAQPARPAARRPTWSQGHGRRPQRSQQPEQPQPDASVSVRDQNSSRIRGSICCRRK